jgi:outer membrane lipoprotein-sorting protein
MKKHSLILAFAAIAIIFASACKKNNNDTDPANTPPSAEAYAKLLNE